jgi:hypothetical protein
MKLASVLFAGVLISAPALCATFTVTNTSDSGAGSLRQALIDADANAGPDTVEFAIPASDPGCVVGGACTIALASPLAQVNDPVIIDGYTQPGSSANTDPVADNAVLVIVLNGSALSGGNGLQVAGGATTVRGLVINGFPVSGITLTGADGNVVEGNFIGTDAGGTAAIPNGTGGGHGVDILAGNGHTIGGLAPAARNLISGNAFTGIRINVLDAITIQGNLIGTQRDGVTPLGNGAHGVGFEFLGGSGSNNVVGGRNAGEANVIAYNVADGVALQPNMNNIPIVGNSIFANVRGGIDLFCCGVTANDPGDVDDGGNHLQNFPIVQSIVHGASTTEVIGKLDTSASTTFDLDFYANPACSNFPREFLQGETYLGSSQVTTDGSGHATFDAMLSVATEAGARISATATDPNGNTSEFSQRIVFSIGPTSGPATGGMALTVSGTDFADPTIMTIGGVAAPVSFVNDHTLTSTSPALGPGTSNDIVVTTPDGTTGVLVKGWVSDFLDVPGGQQFYSFVTTLVSNAITAGVGGGLYGVDQPTLRQQMAVFLLKARHGLCYSPPACTPGFFADVACPSTFAAWIEALANEGITGGCGGNNYCPTNPVRRDQMAVFLLKAEHGSTYTPPACTPPGVFPDVTCPGGFTNWIERLAAENITGGCGGGNYCPGNPSTRGQMAVFITKTFNLQ